MGFKPKGFTVPKAKEPPKEPKVPKMPKANSNSGAGAKHAVFGQGKRYK